MSSYDLPPLGPEPYKEPEFRFGPRFISLWPNTCLWCLWKLHAKCCDPRKDWGLLKPDFKQQCEYCYEMFDHHGYMCARTSTWKVNQLLLYQERELAKGEEPWIPATSHSINHYMARMNGHFN